MNVDALADAINKLGLNNASTPFGAIELLAKEICNGCELIAESNESIASALRDVADAISGVTTTK